MKKFILILAVLMGATTAQAYVNHYDVQRGERLMANCPHGTQIDAIQRGNSMEITCIESYRRPHRPAPRTRPAPAQRCEVVRVGARYELRAGAEVLATAQVRGQASGRSRGGLLGGVVGEVTGTVTAAVRAQLETSLNVQAHLRSGRCSDVVYR